MVLELHVLGQAFDLPSIDAECTAAIAALCIKFGNDETRWTIRASHTSIEQLPELVDGSTKINGFSNICAHLNRSSSSFNADAIALTSLIECRAPVLISAYLYLSYENYSSTTRPAFTPILPLIARYFVPGRIRAAAREQTSQLGISNLDIEALDDKHSASDSRQTSASESAFEATTEHRASFLLPKINTVRSLLAQRPEKLAAFKLRNLSDALLEPLQDMLGESEYLTGHQPLDVDCLAYAYLALMLKPKVPQRWLAAIIQDHYPKVATYVSRMEQRLGFVSAGAIAKRLPWRQPLSGILAGVARSLEQAVIERTSPINPYTILLQAKAPESAWTRHWPIILVFTGSTLAAGATWALHALLNTSHGSPEQIFGQRKMSSFNHLSSTLAGLDFGLSSRNGLTPHHAYSEIEVPASVGLEIEP